jgi:hypothetical protein
VRTGFVYVLVSATLAVILYLAAREHRQKSGETYIFRYPTIWLRVIAFLTPVYSCAALFIYSRDPLVPRSSGFILTLAVLFGGMTVFHALGYFYLKLYEVRVSGGRLYVKIWSREKSISFDQVNQILVVKGGNGVTELTLLDDNGRVLYKVGSTIQDFADLVSLVEECASARRDVTVRRRDEFGRWV